MFERTQKNDDFAKISMLLHGFPKTGKTTFMSKMISADGKEPCFISTEDGAGALEILSIRITSWGGFLRLVSAMEKNQEELRKKHNMIVIDTVADLDEMSAAYVCEQNNITYLGDLDIGKGWKLHKNEFRKALTRLFAILPVSYICHCTEKSVQHEGKEIKVQGPDLSKGCFAFINGKVDIAAYISPPEAGRLPQLCMSNSTTCQAGSRYPQLCGQIDFDISDLSKTYAKLNEMFHGTKTKEITQ